MDSSKPSNPFELRKTALKVLSLTTSEIKVRDPDFLLSEKYPCITCEDNAQLHNYRVRLIFGVECLSLCDFTGSNDFADRDSE